MVEKFTCVDCGAEIEMEGGLANWAKANPDKVRCKDCFGKYTKGQTSKATVKKTSSKSDGCTCGRGTVDAKAFRKAFDELCAEFANELDVVKDYLGGWTSTIVLSRK